MGHLSQAVALVMCIVMLFMLLALNVTLNVSGQQTSLFTATVLPTTIAGQVIPLSSGGAAVPFLTNDMLNGTVPPNAQVPKTSQRPRTSLHIKQLDQFHVLVDGRRKKIPFGTLPGTEAVGLNESIFEGDPTPPGCPHMYFTFVNNFGAHNNQLLTLLNAFAVARNLSRTLVVPPFIQGLNEFATRRVIKPDRFYNFSLFREDGYCFVMSYSPHMGPLLKHAAYRLFRVLPRNMSRPYHLLRPSAFVERETERTCSRLPERYVAVHRRIELRNMYACQVAEDKKPGHCHMRLDYINTARQQHGFPITDPFFVGTDSPQARLNASYIRYTGRLASSHTGAGVVDFWVMTKAALFLGNPASSMSLNVCNIRRTLIPPQPCYDWRWCDDRPPYIAGWPCGSPVEGISDTL